MPLVSENTEGSRSRCLLLPDILQELRHIPNDRPKNRLDMGKPADVRHKLGALGVHIELAVAQVH